jgi:hypothetical protein
MSNYGILNLLMLRSVQLLQISNESPKLPLNLMNFLNHPKTSSFKPYLKSTNSCAFWTKTYKLVVSSWKTKNRNRNRNKNQIKSMS